MIGKIEYVFSKHTPQACLVVIFRYNPMVGSGRVDVIPEMERLQMAFLNLHKNQTFRPHAHIHRFRAINRTQEAWVILRGKVQMTVYDFDNTVLATPILFQGDAGITLAGGHNYKVLEEATHVYEFKLGDYAATGDKEYLDDKQVDGPAIPSTDKPEGNTSGSLDSL